MPGTCALGTPANPLASSLRRVHSPAATRAVASSPPKNSRMPGPIRPASIEYLTRKMPPSASATPPIQTVQRVPNFSSKLMTGSDGAVAADGTDDSGGRGFGSDGGKTGSGSGGVGGPAAVVVTIGSGSGVGADTSGCCRGAAP